MPSVKEVVEIRAEPEKVFDLISRAEDSSRYSSIVKEVRRIGAKTYRWVISIHGIELAWDARVVEMVRPKKFAWRTVRGVQNSGYYILEPVKNGTRVTFYMEYHLSGTVMDKLADIIAGGFIERMASEILNNVKGELEPAE